jgi:hypothetical protein
MNRKYGLGLIGSILLIIAGFSVIVRVPVLGGIEGYLHTGSGSVTIVMILAITSLIFTLKKKYKVLWFTGIASLLTELLLYVYAATVLSKMRAHLEAEYLLNNHPPEGLLESLTMHPVEVLFGGILLAIGAILTIFAAAIKSKRHNIH